MHFNRDSIIQSTSRRFCTDYKSENSIPCKPSGRRVVPSGRPAVQSFSRPDDVSYLPDAHQTKVSSVWTTWIPVRTLLYVEKLRPIPACICPDVSATRPDDSQCSTRIPLKTPSGRRTGWEAFVLGYTLEFKVQLLHQGYVSATIL